MNHFAIGKILTAIFLALVLVMILLLAGQRAARITNPAPVIVKMNGGGTVEIDGQLKQP